MDQVNQGESSGGPSTYLAKRTRGRPRKGPRLTHSRPTHVLPPGFEAPTANAPPKPSRPEPVLDPMVGQTVSGVIETTFDAGYLISIQIGNSTTKLRGLVFKPGHYVPVTPENDVAPHLPMIHRNAIPTADNQNWATPTAPPKRKYTSQKIVSSVPPVGARGNVVPVVLQPVSGLPNSIQMPIGGAQTSRLMDFGDKDVHMVEPLSMLPPGQSIPGSQIFVAGAQPHSSNVFKGGEQKENRLFGEGTSMVGQGEKVELAKSTNAINSSQTSDIQVENGQKALKSAAAEEIGNTSKEPSSNEPQIASVTKPLFSYGTGRMTELLQAVQENMIENQAPNAGV